MMKQTLKEWTSSKIPFLFLFERLNLIMMLYDLDFTVEEIKKYMKLSLEKNERNV
mgnify:CR=1 FL=1